MIDRVRVGKIAQAKAVSREGCLNERGDWWSISAARVLWIRPKANLKTRTAFGSAKQQTDSLLLLLLSSLSLSLSLSLSPFSQSTGLGWFMKKFYFLRSLMAQQVTSRKSGTKRLSLSLFLLYFFLFFSLLLQSQVRAIEILSFLSHSTAGEINWLQTVVSSLWVYVYGLGVVFVCPSLLIHLHLVVSWFVFEKRKHITAYWLWHWVFYQVHYLPLIGTKERLELAHPFRWHNCLLNHWPFIYSISLSSFILFSYCNCIDGGLFPFLMCHM